MPSAKVLVFSPGLIIVLTISWLWPTRAKIQYAQDGSERTYSPIILTNTRFRRRPSRLAGQPFRLALEDPLPRAKGSGEQSETIQRAVRHRDHRCASRPITRNTGSCVPPQVRICIVPSFLSR